MKHVLALVLITGLFLSARAFSQDTVSNWTNAYNGGGNWSDPTQWDTNPLYPDNGNGGNNYDAVIAAYNVYGGNYTVGVDSSVTVDGLTLNSTEAILQLTNGSTFTLDGTAQLDAGNYFVDGGQLSGGTFNVSSSATLSFGGNDILNGVTINGDLTFPQSVGATVQLIGGATFSGVAHLNAFDSTIAFDAGATLNSTISFESDEWNYQGIGSVELNGTDGTFTIGPSGSIITGSILFDQNNYIGLDSHFGGAMNLVNQGLISSQTSNAFAGSQTITIVPSTLSNTGTIQAINGGTLVIAPANPWSNAGTISVTNGGNLYLGGQFNSTGLGNLIINNGSVAITGTMVNTGNNFTLNAATGSWALQGGTIEGGSLSFADNQHLQFASTTTNILDGVTVNGSLSVSGSGCILNGVTLNGDLTIPDYTSPSLSKLAAAQFTGGSTLTGTIHIGAAKGAIAFSPGETINNTISFEGDQSGIFYGVYGSRSVELNGRATERSPSAPPVRSSPRPASRMKTTTLVTIPISAAR